MTAVRLGFSLFRIMILLLLLMLLMCDDEDDDEYSGVVAWTIVICTESRGGMHVRECRKSAAHMI